MSTRAVPDLDGCLEQWSSAQGDADLAGVVAAIAATSASVGGLLAEHLLRGRRSALDRAALGAFRRRLRATSVRSVLAPTSPRPQALVRNGRYAVAIDPFDPTRNQHVNAPLGTIFSVLPVPDEGPETATFLQSGRAIAAAGFVLYGPATVLGLTLGRGTHLFVLDPANGVYRRSQARARIPAASAEVALNASNVRHWSPSLRTFFGDLVDGSQGPYRRDFTIRWVGSVVAGAYRILRSGGLFLYPADSRPGLTQGRLHLVYQAQPIALLIEQAGGVAFDATTGILDKVPTDCHERTPLIFGSPDVVHEVRHYLTTPDFTGEHSPLFGRRGLFRR